MQEIENQYKNQRAAFICALEELLFSYDWGDDLIKVAEKSCGFDPCYSSIIFPNGLSEIIEEFIASGDLRMLDKLQNTELPSKIRDKISLALNIRIKSLSQSSHQKTMRYFANPMHSAAGLKLTWRTSDLIWRFCKDESVDFNFYSKRALLSSVYGASILFYISDKSQDQVETSEFINNSIEKIVKFGNFKRLIKLPKLENIPIFRLLS